MLVSDYVWCLIIYCRRINEVLSVQWLQNNNEHKNIGF